MEALPVRSATISTQCERCHLPRSSKSYFIAGCRSQRQSSAMTFTTWRLLLALPVLMQIIAVGAFPRLCSEAGPFDILAHALSGRHGQADGVDLAAVDGVRGYRFQTSARLAGVDSNVIFTHCNRFPAEFSIVVTFARNEAPVANEFLMTLLAQDHTTVLFALRLRNQRLYFDYMSHGDLRTESVKDPRFTDGAWHTAIITVTTKSVKFSLDCGAPLVRPLDAPFPKRLNVKGTRIYVASRRKKTKQFQGLLRQLVLYPGSDASVRLCSSSYPPLGAAQPAVPKVVFEGDTQDFLCTSSNRGTLKYKQDKTMDVCTGSRFQPVRGGRERMDYIVDFEDFNFAHTVKMEWFEIPGEGLFLATANPNTTASYILKWDGAAFQVVQTIMQGGIMHWKYFQINSDHYLAMTVFESRCAIYRWSGRRKMFKRYQWLDVSDARSIEAFSIGSAHFLVVAQFGIRYDKKVDPVLGVQPTALSEVFVMGGTGYFSRYQTLDGCFGAVDVTFFHIQIGASANFYCFVVARSFNGLTSKTNSHIYCWNGMKFGLYQRIMTHGAVDWEYFRIEDRHYLAVANSVSLNTTAQNYTARSTIYTLSYLSSSFVHFQDMETYGASDWEFFTIGSQYFIAMSNSQPKVNETTPADSVIYRWKGIEKFVPEHQLPVGRGSDFDYIPIVGEHYLTLANPQDDMSKLYKIVTY